MTMSELEELKEDLRRWKALARKQYECMTSDVYDLQEWEDALDDYLYLADPTPDKSNYWKD